MQKLNIPDDINSYTHKFFEHVRCGDIDGHNHVNNVSFSRYFESARVDIIRSLETKKYSFVIVSFSINYFSQVFYPSNIEIGSSLENIGKSSLSIMHGLFVDGKCKSTAKSILAYADLQKNKPKTISKELKLQIKNILRGGASDEI